MKKIYLLLVAMIGALWSSAAIAQELSKYDYSLVETNPLITEVSQLSSPCSDSAEGSLGALIGMPDTHPDNAFWHSDWHGVYQGKHYFQVELPDDVELTDVLAFEFQRRQVNNGNHITQWGVYGTNDPDLDIPQEECTLLRICDTPYGGDNTAIVYEVFPHKGFKYIRFYCEDTDTHNGFFHLATFQLFTTVKNDAAGIARQKLLDLYDQVKGAVYISGDFLGAIDESLVTEFYAALDEAVAQGDNVDATAEQLNALTDRLKAAYEACEAAAKLSVFKPGNYYLLNAKSVYNAASPDGRHFGMNMYNATTAGWAWMDYEDPNFVWQFTQAGVDDDGDAYYHMRNYGSELYANTLQTSEPLVLVAEENAGPIYVESLGDGTFIVYTANDGGHLLHQRGHGGADLPETATGDIVGWNEWPGSASCWYLIPVDDATLANMEAAKEQLKIQEQFNNLLNQATITYSRAFEYELPDDAEDVTPLSADDFLSNAARSAEHGYSWGDDGQGYGALIDGDINTWFHTDYTGTPQGTNVKWTAYDDSGEPTSWAEPTTKHNLMMHLPKAVTEVGFEFNPRNSTYYWDSPRDIDVLVSNDGETWTLVAEGYDRFNLYEGTSTFLDDVPVPKRPAYTGPIQLGGSYEWVRFDVNASRRSIYFNLSELRVWVGMKAKETSQAAQMSEQTVRTLQDALDAAKKVVKATSSDLAALQAALDQFKAEFVDPSELQDAVSKAKNLLTTVLKVETNEDGIAGDGLGYYREGCVTSDDLQTAIEEADAALEAGVSTKTQLESLQQKVASAVEAAQAALAAGMQSEIETDKWYQIRFPSYEEFEQRGWNLGNGESENDVIWGKVATVAIDKEYEIYPDEVMDNIPMFSMDPDILENVDMSLWRFIPVGDAYVIQNKGTGLFIHLVAIGRENPNTIGSTPTLFKVEGLGYGKVVLRSYDFLTEEPITALHFQLDNCLMVGWSTYTLGTNSALELVEAGDVGGENELGSFYSEVREGQAYTYCFASRVTRNLAEGGKMYAVTGQFEDEDLAYVGLEEITEAAAGEPFVFIAENPFNDYALTAYADFRLTGDITREAGEKGGLKGTFATVAAQNGDGVLALDEQKGSFWRVVSGGSVNVDAMTAYIPAITNLSTCDPTEVCILLGSVPVGINGTKATAAKVSDVYNLQGQKVGTTADITALKRGIYVIKGRKVIVP